MMRLRKWSSLNKAEKLGRKNAFLVSLIYSILIFIVLALILIALASNPYIDVISFFKDPFMLVFLPFCQFGLPILYYFSTKNHAIQCAYDTCIRDYSKKLAEKMLVRGKPTKIKLLKTRDGHYSDFLLKDLPVRVDYYAVLKENHNIIVIYPKFSDENEKDFFDDISNERRNSFDFIEMEEFSSFCEILDD